MEILAVAVHRNAKCVEFVLEKSEGKTPYEMEYKEEGKEYELLYGTDGSLLQKDEEIEIQALPTLTGQAIEKAHPGAKIKEAEKVMKSYGAIIGYEAEIAAAGQELEFELDTAGKSWAASGIEPRLNSKERG